MYLRKECIQIYHDVWNTGVDRFVGEQIVEIDEAVIGLINQCCINVSDLDLNRIFLSFMNFLYKESD